MGPGSCSASAPPTACCWRWSEHAADDRRIVMALREGGAATLRSLPAPALMAGSSEIRSRITLAGMVAGMVQGMRSEWLDYTPIYRTPAGAGIGMASGAWG